MGKYSIDDLNMVNTRYRSIDGTVLLSLRVWRGTTWLSVNGAKDNAKIFSKGLKYEEIALLGQFMNEFLKSEPGKEFSAVYNSYNRQERKRVMEFIFVLKKDEKSIYHVIIKANNSTFDFPIIYSNTITYGTGEIPEAERSYRAFVQLINHIKNVIPFQLNLTNVPSDRPGFNNNSGGGKSGGYQKGGGNYGGQGDFQSPKNLPSDDDIFSQD